MTEIVAQNEGTGPKKIHREERISMDTLGRFLAPVMQVFDKELDEEDRGKHRGFVLLVEDLKETGFDFLRQPDENETSGTKYRPYRRFLKVLAIYSLENRADKGTIDHDARAALGKSDKYTAQQLSLIERCFEDQTISEFIRNTHRYCVHLANKDLYFFYDIISMDTGNQEIDLGNEGKCKVINRSTWGLKQYFHFNFFPSKHSGQKLGTDEKNIFIDPYLILIKFIVDSALFGEKKKRKFKVGNRGADYKTVDMKYRI